MPSMSIEQAMRSALQHQQSGRLAEAQVIYQEILQRQPENAMAWHLMGALAGQMGKPSEAIAACREAVRLKPDFAEALSNLGNALADRGDWEGAEKNCRAALRLKPHLAQAHFNLGLSLQVRGKLEEAIGAYRQAIRLMPGYAKAHNNLCGALSEMGLHEEALAGYRAAVELLPGDPVLHSSLVFALNYRSGSGREHFADACRWARRHAEPLAAQARAHDNDRDPRRRIRVGYLSPDFREHSVMRFMEPLLARHDHQRVEVFCYSDTRSPDATTERLRRCADGWRDTAGRSDAEVAETVRADRIDILVDLAGHTAGNRLLVLARRPAPILAHYLGYPATTGARLDYRLTDGLSDPAETGEDLHTEQLWRLPVTNWCFATPADAPDVAPAVVAGAICFGSFNYSAKISPETVDCWARVVLETPGSRLLLKSRALDDAAARRGLAERFAARGLGAERLELQGWHAGCASHLGAYAKVDIGLDTFPYNGTTTTCEALWMGVPVVALAGAMHVARVGVSLLTNVGLPELIARSTEEYVAIAGALAGDGARRAELRRRLRERMLASPLMDAEAFARHVEEAYGEMWRIWCARGRRV